MTEMIRSGAVPRVSGVAVVPTPEEDRGLRLLARCAEPGCLRLVWRDGLCWWCWQFRRPGVPQ